MTVAGKAPVVAGPSRGHSRPRLAQFRIDDEFPGIAKYVFGHSLLRHLTEPRSLGD